MIVGVGHLDLQRLNRLMRYPIVVDGRISYDPSGDA